MSKHCCYRLEQLARLGLPSQVFIPAFLQELHHDIPSLSNTFCWQDSHGHLNNIYDEMSNTEVIKHFVRSMASTEPDKYSHTVNWVSNLEQVVTTFDFYEKSSQLAEFYKTILLPLGYLNSAFIPVIQSESTIRLGVLMAHRQDRQPYFTQIERDKLTNAASFIAYGLSQPSIEHQYKTDGRKKGLLITDLEGNLQHACPMGEKLLTLSSSSTFNTDAKYTPLTLRAFKGLDTLITQLINTGKHTSNQENPTLTTCNGWGEFILRGFLIQDKAGVRSQQIGLNIHWQEPFVLKLFHRIKNLNLTPRQETVGLLYAAGDPHQVIADKLDLSLYTVKEHVKNICERLSINTRGDLIERILCDAP